MIDGINQHTGRRKGHEDSSLFLGFKTSEAYFLLTDAANGKTGQIFHFVII